MPWLVAEALGADEAVVVVAVEVMDRVEAADVVRTLEEVGAADVRVQPVPVFVKPERQPVRPKRDQRGRPSKSRAWDVRQEHTPLLQ